MSGANDRRREQAKRAKMVARFNANKHQSSYLTSVNPAAAPVSEAIPSTEACNAEPIPILIDTHQEISDNSSTSTTSALSRNSYDNQPAHPPASPRMPSTHWSRSTSIAESRKNHQEISDNHSISAASALTQNSTDSQPSHPHPPSSPRTPCTPRSRSKSIAEAKKKLAAARMVSSSAAAIRRDKTIIGELSSKISYEEKMDANAKTVLINSEGGRDTAECSYNTSMNPSLEINDSKSISETPEYSIGSIISEKCAEFPDTSSRYDGTKHVNSSSSVTGDGAFEAILQNGGITSYRSGKIERLIDTDMQDQTQHKVPLKSVKAKYEKLAKIHANFRNAGKRTINTNLSASDDGVVDANMSMGMGMLSHGLGKTEGLSFDSVTQDQSQHKVTITDPNDKFEELAKFQARSRHAGMKALNSNSSASEDGAMTYLSNACGQSGSGITVRSSIDNDAQDQTQQNFGETNVNVKSEICDKPQIGSRHARMYFFNSRSSASEDGEIKENVSRLSDGSGKTETLSIDSDTQEQKHHFTATNMNTKTEIRSEFHASSPYGGLTLSEDGVMEANILNTDRLSDAETHHYDVNINSVNDGLCGSAKATNVNDCGPVTLEMTKKQDTKDNPEVHIERTKHDMMTKNAAKAKQFRRWQRSNMSLTKGSHCEKAETIVKGTTRISSELSLAELKKNFQNEPEELNSCGSTISTRPVRNVLTLSVKTEDDDATKLDPTNIFLRPTMSHPYDRDDLQSNENSRTPKSLVERCPLTPRRMTAMKVQQEHYQKMMAAVLEQNRNVMKNELTSTLTTDNLKNDSNVDSNISVSIQSSCTTSTSFNSTSSEDKTSLHNRPRKQIPFSECFRDTQSDHQINRWDPPLNHLASSTSDAQSFVPIEGGSAEFPKLAGDAFLTDSNYRDFQYHTESDEGSVQDEDEWPIDAFSPTAWGAEESNWNTPDTPQSVATPALIVQENGGLSQSNAHTIINWEENKGTDVMKKKNTLNACDPWGSAEWDDDPSKTAPADDDDVRDDWINDEARAEAEARILELEKDGSWMQLAEEASSSVQYEGFGAHVGTDCPSRRDSRDASPSCEQRDSPPGIQAKFSEETMGSVTEFDPLSMFDGCDSFSQDIDKQDSFPAVGINNCNDKSETSWASEKLLSRNDSKSSAFASLRASTPMDASFLSSTPTSKLSSNFSKSHKSVDSPDGNESLESWWQNRITSTQNKDINAVVREALMEDSSTPAEEQRSDLPTERCTSSARCKPQIQNRMPPQNNCDVVSKDPLCNRANNLLKNSPSSPNDEDSIFCDLDDDSVQSQKFHTSLGSFKNFPRRKNSQSTAIHGTIVSKSETEEDIFAGVSVNSRQVIRPKDPINYPIKSLFDGSTTTESNSLLQRTKTSSKEPECLEHIVEEQSKSLGLFLPDGDYGEINLQNNVDGVSPSGASVTSDITTSVIFGGEFGKRKFHKKGTYKKYNFVTEKGIPESITKVNRVLSGDTMNPVFSPVNKVQMSVNGQDCCEDTENVDPQIEQTGDNDVSSPDYLQKTRGEGVQDSNPSLLKRAFLMAKIGGQEPDKNKSAPNSECSTVTQQSEALEGTKKSFVSQFSCNILGASSFAFCASKARNGLPVEDLVPNMEGRGMANKKHSLTSSQELEVTESFPVPILKFGSDRSDNIGKSRSAIFRRVESKLSSRSILETLQADSWSGGATRSDENDDDIEGNSEDDKSSTSGECLFTLEECKTLNSAGQRVSTHDSFSLKEDQEGSYRKGEGPEVTHRYECPETSELVPLSEQEHRKGNAWESKDHTSISSENKPLPHITKNQEDQILAHEKLLFYAYSALSVPPPNVTAEKGEGIDPLARNIEYPPVLSPRAAELRCDAMKQLFTRLGEEGMEVLKLNRERKWQPRVLTITKEVDWFKQSDDIRYSKIDCCPQGLLWVKKFSGHSKEHSAATIGKFGKGGIMFHEIKSISVTSDNFSLSRKQRKGKFKDSFTFVLHADFSGTKRDILFRCSSKDDICILSSCFQAVIDRIKNDSLITPRPSNCQQDNVSMTVPVTPEPLVKPFSPKESEDHGGQWEL